MKSSNDSESGPRELGEGRAVAVHERTRRHALRGCGQHVLQRVVVRAGLQPDLVALLPVIPGQHVGLDELQREPQVRAGVDVGNGGADVNALGTHGSLLLSGGSDAVDA